VEFIVVGGIAAILQASPLTTENLDAICHSSGENRSRLLAALAELPPLTTKRSSLPRVWAVVRCRGCAVPPVLLAGLLVAVVLKECPGEVARWRGQPEGQVVVRPGMSKDEVRRESTVAISTHGDSGRFVDIELTSDKILLSGIQMFVIDEGEGGQVDYVSLTSANESWPDLVRAAIRTEETLLGHGWKPEAGQPSVRSLTRNPREAAAAVTESGAIAYANFVFWKEDERLELAAGGLWSGIPWWRPASRAKVFWRSMNYFPAGYPFTVDATAPRFAPATAQ
jgi:hypothetical protein